MNFTGTAGNDTIVGTADDDVFNMKQGGSDTVTGLQGNDVFSFGAAFDGSDQIDGGMGNDVLKISGDYSAGVAFTATTLVNVEKLEVAAGHSYLLSDDHLAAGAKLDVLGSTLGTSDVLNFEGNGSDGRFVITGGAGADILDGGHGDDSISGGAAADSIRPGSGDNTVNGGDGDDLISFQPGETFNIHDRIDGGGGSDSVSIIGDYSATHFTFKATTLTNVEELSLNGGNFFITTNDGNVAAGQQLDVNASLLNARQTLTFHGEAETDGSYTVTGGAGGDTLVGGAGNDRFTGGAGADRITGGAGQDIFNYNLVSESTNANFDHVSDFNASIDLFHMPTVPTAIDGEVMGGPLTSAHFDLNLGNAIGAAQLGAGDAVLFAPSSGYLSGHTLMVVDANGVAGYQAGADFVIDVTGMTGTLTVADFV